MKQTSTFPNKTDADEHLNSLPENMANMLVVEYKSRLKRLFSGGIWLFKFNTQFSFQEQPSQSHKKSSWLQIFMTQYLLHEFLLLLLNIVIERHPPPSFLTMSSANYCVMQRKQ